MADETRTVLTTGANSGLGLATTIEVARKGFRSIGSVRSAAKAALVHQAGDEAGVEVETVLLDVADAGQCAELIGGLDLFGLVNNAGYSVTGAVEEITDEEARAVIETMTIAPIRLARLALPAMRAAGGGRIVNISSIYGRTSTPFTGWYQAAKQGLEGVSDALRMEVARDGIHVALVEPGAFRTNIFNEAQRDFEGRGEDSPYVGGYRRSMRAMRMFEPLMGDPGAVARLVGKILTTPLPRARYLAGRDAFAVALTEQAAPTFIRDRITRFVLGL
jgi:NAD(P)-dependent dehydrogenase (short-subunit alcohol dehydrogenase family)